VHAVAVVLGRDRGQRVGLVAKALEVAGGNLAEDAGKTAGRVAFFPDVGAPQQRLADLRVGQRVHLFQADHQRAFHAAAAEGVERRPDGGRSGGAGVFKPHGRRVAQFGNGQRRQRAGEVLAHEAAVEVADEDAVDVRRLQARAGDGGQSRVTDQLLQVDLVVLAEGRVAPADDVLHVHGVHRVGAARAATAERF
jgi:hypothetical protein